MFLKKCKLLNISMCIIIVLSVLSLIIPRSAGAENQNNNSKSLTLVCVSDDTILSGMEWKLYKVGERINSNRNFTQTGDFASFQINFSRLTEERVNEAAQTFQSYAIANNIAPLREGITDENGEVTFTELDAGLYLVTGKILKVDNHYYVPTTALIEIKEDDQNLKYNAYPKFEYEVANSEVHDYIVEKKWIGDDNNLSKRPVSITVDIYRNEEYYDTVILNEENNWKYQWSEQDTVSSWIVFEREIPANYEVEIKYDSSHYSIANYYSEEQGTSTTTNGSSTVTTSTTTTANTTATGELTDDTATGTVTTPTTDNTATRTGTASTSNQNNDSVTRTRKTTTRNNNDKVTTTYRSSGKSDSGDSKKLPQTGQLWWPVVPLSIGGILLIAGGLAIKNKKKDD